MKIDKRMLSPAIELVLGAALIAAAKFCGLDSVWLGMGGALIAVGTLQFLNLLRYQKDADYREKVDTESHDERNQFIRQKTWVWAGSCFVMIEGLFTVVMLILGKNEAATITGGAVCLITLLYWVCHFILKRKY